WDVQTGAPLHILSGDTDLIWTVAYSPDNKTVLTGSLDGTARLWDAHSGTLLNIFPGFVGGGFAGAYSPRGQTLLIGTADGNEEHGVAVLWDSENYEVIRPLCPLLLDRKWLLLAFGLIAVDVAKLSKEAFRLRRSRHYGKMSFRSSFG